jgi:hypothetical protein
MVSFPLLQGFEHKTSGLVEKITEPEILLMGIREGQPFFKFLGHLVSAGKSWLPGFPRTHKCRYFRTYSIFITLIPHSAIGNPQYRGPQSALPTFTFRQVLGIRIEFKAVPGPGARA